MRHHRLCKSPAYSPFKRYGFAELNRRAGCTQVIDVNMLAHWMWSSIPYEATTVASKLVQNSHTTHRGCNALVKLLTLPMQEYQFYLSRNGYGAPHVLTIIATITPCCFYSCWTRICWLAGWLASHWRFSIQRHTEVLTIRCYLIVFLFITSIFQIHAAKHDITNLDRQQSTRG